jgi:lathosterol oxidase
MGVVEVDVLGPVQGSVSLSGISHRLQGYPWFGELLKTEVEVLLWMTIVYYGLTGLQWWLFYSPSPKGLTWIQRWARTRYSKFQPGKPKQNITEVAVTEIVWSFSTIVVGSVLVSIVLWAYRSGLTNLYFDIHEYGLPYYILSICMMLGFNDTWMYWTHRWLHSPFLFSKVHKLHHRFYAPTPFSTMAFHPVEAVVQFTPMLGALFVPLHIPTLFVLSAFLLIVSVTEHLGFRLPFYEKFSFISTPLHHDLHHSVYRCNYAVYFTFWDKFMGTQALEHNISPTLKKQLITEQFSMDKTFSSLEKLQ